MKLCFWQKAGQSWFQRSLISFRGERSSEKSWFILGLHHSRSDSSSTWRFSTFLFFPEDKDRNPNMRGSFSRLLTFTEEVRDVRDLFSPCDWIQQGHENLKEETAPPCGLWWDCRLHLQLIFLPGTIFRAVFKLFFFPLFFLASLFFFNQFLQSTFLIKLLK